MDQKMYFFEILNTLFAENSVGIKKNRDLIEKMKPEILRIRSLQRYRSGVTVPSFEMALKILDCFGMKIQTNELDECLKAGREYARELRQGNNNRLNTSEARSPMGITVSNCQISCVDSPEMMTLLKSRVKEMYGSESNIRMYIAELIEKDLLKYSEKGEN